MKNLINIGRRLSYLLRHNPEDLEMDIHGWVSIDDMLDKLKISKNLLDEIVYTNDKKRYSYSENGEYIRANQGHSLKVDVELKDKLPPKVLYHGTSPKNIKPIMKNGLMKMNRNHVHLSSDIETAINVGKRHSKNDKPVVFVIDCMTMVKDDYMFYLSENGVWLTDHVPPKYLSKWE